MGGRLFSVLTKTSYDFWVTLSAVNRKDYRGWYGLGQAYELLNMHNYALHYYQRGAALRPYDVRMWQAMGMCYQDLNR